LRSWHQRIAQPEREFEVGQSFLRKGESRTKHGIVNWARETVVLCKASLKLQKKLEHVREEARGQKNGILELSIRNMNKLKKSGSRVGKKRKGDGGGLL